MVESYSVGVGRDYGEKINKNNKNRERKRLNKDLRRNKLIIFVLKKFVNCEIEQNKKKSGKKIGDKILSQLFNGNLMI